MPELSGSNYSEVDASNNNAAPNGFPEGMAFSGVNDAMRAFIGAVMRAINRLTGRYASTGSDPNYQVAPTQALAAYVIGERYSFRANFTNAGQATLNVSGLGAKIIKKMTNAGKADLAAGDIQSGQPVTVEYDGTDMIMTTPPCRTTLASATDYAEGSFTPALAGSVTAGTATYSFQGGQYVRAGNLVTIWGTVVCTSFSGAAGSVLITGLPFTSSNISGIVFPIAIGMAGGTLDYAAGYTWLTGEVSGSSITIYQHGDSIGSANLSVSALTATTNFRFGGQYRIN